MEFNKIVSLVLGFIVVVLLLVFVVGRMQGKNTGSLFSKAKVTTTPTPKPDTQATEKKGWNPFGFLFRKSTPTPTPAKNVAVNPTDTAKGNVTPLPQGGMTGTTQGTTIQRGEQPVAQPTLVSQQPQNVTQYNTVNGVTQIPNTGAPTFMLPLAFSMLAGGTFLSRAKKK